MTIATPRPPARQPLAFPLVAIAGQVGGRSGKLGGLRKSAFNTFLIVSREMP